MARDLFRAVVALAALLSMSGAAQAQAITVRADCARFVPQNVSFDDRTHLLWYNRFWTGDCAGLFGCLRGEPNWDSWINILLAQTSADRRPALLERACRIGHMIGLEWAKDNGIRKIDTRAVRGFGEALKAAGDPFAKLAAVDARARAMLAQ
jgi:hypothetical protein